MFNVPPESFGTCVRTSVTPADLTEDQLNYLNAELNSNILYVPLYGTRGL